MTKLAEDKTNLEIAEEDYEAICTICDIVEALRKEITPVLQRTALNVVNEKVYKLLEHGEIRLERARGEQQ
jgi:hypothetical protein